MAQWNFRIDHWICYRIKLLKNEFPSLPKNLKEKVFSIEKIKVRIDYNKKEC